MCPVEFRFCAVLFGTCSLAEIPHKHLIRVCKAEGAGCKIDAGAGVQGGGCEGGDGCDGLGRAHL